MYNYVTSHIVFFIARIVENRNTLFQINMTLSFLVQGIDMNLASFYDTVTHLLKFECYTRHLCHRILKQTYFIAQCMKAMRISFK